MADFVIPELGEGVAGGDVVRLLVKPGDTLKKEQPVLELETDKATIEVPSSVAGVVKELKIKTGDKVKVGQVVLTVDEASASAPAAPPAGATADKAGGTGQGHRRRKAHRSGSRQARGPGRRRTAARRGRAHLAVEGRGHRPGDAGACRPRPPRPPAPRCQAAAAWCRRPPRRVARRASWAWTSRRSRAPVPAAASPSTT